jgi:hypothetical protein
VTTGASDGADFAASVNVGACSAPVSSAAGSPFVFPTFSSISVTGYSISVHRVVYLALCVCSSGFSVAGRYHQMSWPAVQISPT